MFLIGIPGFCPYSVGILSSLSIFYCSRIRLSYKVTGMLYQSDFAAHTHCFFFPAIYVRYLSILCTPCGSVLGWGSPLFFLLLYLFRFPNAQIAMFQSYWSRSSEFCLSRCHTGKDETIQELRLSFLPTLLAGSYQTVGGRFNKRRQKGSIF